MTYQYFLKPIVREFSNFSWWFQSIFANCNSIPLACSLLVAATAWLELFKAFWGTIRWILLATLYFWSRSSARILMLWSAIFSLVFEPQSSVKLDWTEHREEGKLQFQCTLEATLFYCLALIPTSSYFRAKKKTYEYWLLEGKTEYFCFMSGS